MVAPGKRFYATRLPALSFSECRRMTGGGGVMGALVWLITRFKGCEGRALMPQLQAETRAERNELSPVAQEQLRSPEEQALALGYQIAFFQHLPNSSDATIVDNGGFVAVSADGRRLVLVNFIRQQKPHCDAPSDLVTLACVGMRGESASVGVTNFNQGLDVRRGCESEYRETTSLAALDRRLRELMEKSPEDFVEMRTAEDIAIALDREDLANFEDRVKRRRLFVPVA